MGNTHMVNVNFTLLHAETELGQQMLLCGSAAELGNWDPDRGIVLTTDPASYPTWHASVDFAIESIDGPFFYKYIRDYRGCGGGLDWEFTERQFVPIIQDRSKQFSARDRDNEISDELTANKFLDEEIDDAAMGA